MHVCVAWTRAHLCAFASVSRSVSYQAMKRESEEGTGPPAKRAGVVRLNVGGRHFDTTKDTLSKCTYFAPYIEGRIDHATDEDGRLFIDRSGEYFSRILQFMRTS